MARRAYREMSMEEYEAWSEANDALKQERAAVNEVGGRELSYLPVPTTASARDAGGPPDNLEDPLASFEPEPSRYRAGWSAYRQRVFILALAESGSVHQAAREAMMSARSAYALRVRSAAFREAWDKAQQLAVGRLSAIAFDRAINGRPEQLFQDGQLVGERRVPNDRLLQWLLARLDPKRFAMPWEQRGDIGDPQGVAAAAFPALIDAIEDVLPFEPFPMTSRVDGTTGETLGGEPSGDSDEPARDRENW